MSRSRAPAAHRPEAHCDGQDDAGRGADSACRRPVGVKTQGGILEHVLREVEIECLPGDIPSHLDVDVIEPELCNVLHVSDLPHSGQIKFLADEDATVAHVIVIREEVRSRGRAAAATPAEPEVAKKGKGETAAGCCCRSAR